MIRTAIIIGLTLSMSGCATVKNSRVNPFNWFGGTETVASEVNVVAQPARPGDKRMLINEITELKLEPTNAGAILRVTGLPPAQGWWDAELVERKDSATGELVLEFRIDPPFKTPAIGTAASREVTVAHHISAIKLRNIHSITVIGAQAARNLRR